MNALPEPTQYLLTVSELITTPLSAKLVVISGGHRTDSPRVTSKGLMCMAQALLAAGAECVVIPIWPSSFQASRLMMNAFYSSLIYGSKASRALRYAMQVCRMMIAASCCGWCVFLVVRCNVQRHIMLLDNSYDVFVFTVQTRSLYCMCTSRGF